jgi:hypothetical protein
LRVCDGEEVRRFQEIRTRNDKRRVVVRLATEEEGERDPERGEAGRASDANQAGLNKCWLGDGVFPHGNEDPQVRHVRVLRGIVREESVHPKENDGLNTDGDVEHDSPRCELGDDPADDPGVEDTAQQAGKDEGDGGGSPVRRGKVSGQWDKNLRDYGEDAD